MKPDTPDRLEDSDSDTRTDIERVISDLKDTIEQQQTQIESLQQTVEEQQREIEDLKDDIDTAGRARGKIRLRVSDLEDAADSGETEVETTADPDPTPEPETPLEEIVRIPERLVEQSLTANQERARFVAKDVTAYSRSVNKGREIRSTDLRKVLSAKSGEQVYTQTVSRVMDYLADLGEDDVIIRTRNDGERAVVFDKSLTKRLQAYAYHRNEVVTDEEVSAA
jgi:septal ring factor EnvC (AmiA/AmiB activator)